MDPEADFEQAMQGDLEALCVFLFRYQPRFLALIRSRLPSGLRQHAEDVWQNALVNICVAFAKRDQSFDNLDGFETWLGRVTANACNDFWKHVNAQIRACDRTLALAGEVRDHHDDPDRAARRTDRIQRLRDCLAMLCQEDRSLIVLRYFEGLSAAEVGKRFAQTGNWVGVECFRIRRRLAACLGDPDALLSSSS